jgi:hypothetical protein
MFDWCRGTLKTFEILSQGVEVNFFFFYQRQARTSGHGIEDFNCNYCDSGQ